jgi:uncharacterized protein (DUF1800 family)
VFALWILVVTPVFGQTPAEVQDLNFGDPSTLFWDPAAGADVYHVYRGSVSGVDGSDPARCHGFEIVGTIHSSPETPKSGEGFFYLVTGEALAGDEGTPGVGPGAAVRPLLGRCRPVLRTHILDRLGFGWSEWSRDRIEALGFDAYIAEQLDPASINEANNTELNTRLAQHDPPPDIVSLIARQVISAVYSRRQLEQQVATFWSNHFNTFWLKLFQLYATAYPNCEFNAVPQCDPNYPEISYLEASLAQFREMQDFRALGFSSNFRQILETSALSPAMILFLDTYANVAGAPNENYARELLELYVMGVDGGYTQTDVEETARVLTGWTICKKTLADVGDPLAPCISEYWLAKPAGEWTANFNPANHDCGAKTLFVGTPEQVDIPDTCGNPPDGVTDLGLALDGMASHPATARFISTKILQRFVTDTPDAAMIDDLVAVWNDGTNPARAGDLRAVLEAALTHAAFLDPDRVRQKIKTPLEHIAGAIRAVRGQTDGNVAVLTTLVNASHIPHYNPVPTGWPEVGDSWLDTTNTLERQNFGVYLTAFDNPEFGSDLMGLLADHGVSTVPGNADGIVDFFSNVFYGGALTPSERQQAIDFLNTDINGTPSAYDETRIRRTVGFLLGYPQFQEQ